MPYCRFHIRVGFLFRLLVMMKRTHEKFQDRTMNEGLQSLRGSRGLDRQRRTSKTIQTGGRMPHEKLTRRLTRAKASATAKPTRYCKIQIQDADYYAELWGARFPRVNIPLSLASAPVVG